MSRARFTLFVILAALLVVAAIWMVWPKFFFEDFFGNFLATLLGAAVGIPIALFIENYISEQAEKRSEKVLLHALRASLQNNSLNLEKIVNGISQGKGSYFSVNTTILEATITSRHGLVENQRLNNALDNLLRLLELLQRMLDTRINVLFNPGFLGKEESFTKLDKPLRTTLVEYSELAIKLIHKIILLIDQELA